MKILRSKKALSPVVASIILIAVTVAVSIAVAAWMGALTIGFMGTEQLSFKNFEWADDLAHVNMTVKNTGTATLTIDTIKINNLLNGTGSGWTVTTSGKTATLAANEEVKIQITASSYLSGGFVAGDSYAFLVVTAKNNPFGPYTISAPS